jgi:calcineurin-like phosphoesterase family protein
MDIWFTADLHLAHDTVAEYRGFKSAHKHDKAVIGKYNKNIKDGDTVYIVGDICMWGPRNIERVEDIVRKLRGQKHLILGNHDKIKPFDYVEMGIVSVHTALEVQWHMANFIPNSSELWKPVMVHDPSAAATDIDRAWICGHIHSLFKRIGRVLNVGVDVWDLRPVHIAEVYAQLRHAHATEEQKMMAELAGKMRHDDATRDKLAEAAKEAQELIKDIPIEVVEADGLSHGPLNPEDIQPGFIGAEPPPEPPV